jgi:hypothetical protein
MQVWRFREEKICKRGSDDGRLRGLGKSFCKHWVIASMEERYLQGSANVLAFIFKGIVLKPNVERCPSSASLSISIKGFEMY